MYNDFLDQSLFEQISHVVSNDRVWHVVFFEIAVVSERLLAHPGLFAICTEHYVMSDFSGKQILVELSKPSFQLRQMDRTIESVVRQMRDDDLLVVVGDHGMTSSGDHGGDAEAEVTAGLMVSFGVEL